jgi:hypothetical protein
MTIEKLSEAIDKLSERLAIQEMTLNVIKEAADRLEEKLSLVMEIHVVEPYEIKLSDEDVDKLKKFATDRYYLPERFRDTSNGE